MLGLELLAVHGSCLNPFIRC